MTCFLAFWRSFAAPSAKALTHASLCSESPLKPRRGVAELAGRFPFWPPPLPWRHATTRRTRCPPGRIGARSSHGSSCAHGAVQRHHTTKQSRNSQFGSISAPGLRAEHERPIHSGRTAWFHGGPANARKRRRAVRAPGAAKRQVLPLSRHSRKHREPDEC